MEEMLFEVVVLKHPDLFSADAVEKSRKRLAAWQTDNTTAIGGGIRDAQLLGDRAVRGPHQPEPEGAGGADPFLDVFARRTTLGMAAGRRAARPHALPSEC